MQFRFHRLAYRPGRSLALALALVGGAAVGTASLAPPAYAQGKVKISRGFQKVYSEVVPLLQGEEANFDAAKAKVPDLVAAIDNEDDRNIAGNTLFNIGTNTDDTALQLQGINLMIQSGKNEQDRLGSLYWTAYQLNRELGNGDAAREAIENAVGVNYVLKARMADGTTKEFGQDDLRQLVADDYFSNDDYAGGLAYLRELITTRAASGQTPPASWIRRGFASAYNNDMANESVEFSLYLVKHHPTQSNWRDAINVQRNLIMFEDSELLDLLRLADARGTLTEARDYSDYVNAADSLRRPSEVKRVLDKGVAAGLLNSSDPFIAEAMRSSASRSAGEKADLSTLERDAKAGGGAKLALTSGDSYLSNEMGAQAEAMYQVALSRPGVDTGAAYTHMGMAQLQQGKVAEAMASFDKVEGKRKPIALLWKAHAESLAGGGM